MNTIINTRIITIFTDYLIDFCGIVNNHIDIEENMPRKDFIRIYNRTMSVIKELRSKVLINKESFGKFMYEIFSLSPEHYDVEDVYMYISEIINETHDKLLLNKRKYI